MYPGGWALADVPYSFLLGLVTGFPYLSVIGWLLAVRLKYLDVITGDTASFGWLPVVVWPSLVYLMEQFVENWILTPLVQSRSMEMSAITVLIHRVHRRGCRRLLWFVAPHSDRRLH